jgi:hypothetical protein
MEITFKRSSFPFAAVLTCLVSWGCESSAPSVQNGVDGGTVGSKGLRLWKAASLPLTKGSRVNLSIGVDDRVVLAFATGSADTFRINVATGTTEALKIYKVAEIAKDPLDDDGSPVAVAHDSKGRIHIAWAHGGIRYAVGENENWTVETVANVGTYPTLALDANDVPHVAFLNARELHYAFRSTGGWQRHTVGPSRKGHKHTQLGLVVTKTGDPWLASADAERVLFWRPDGNGGWISEHVFENTEQTKLFGLHALALDKAGQAHVAFARYYDLFVAHRSSKGQWVAEPLTCSGMQWSWSPQSTIELTIADDGRAFVLATADSRFGSASKVEGVVLFERAKGASSWSFQLLLGSGCGGDAALALDRVGAPHLAHGCEGITLLSAVGQYPADWQKRCVAVATTLCERACNCNSSFEPCTWRSGFGVQGTSASGCTLNMANVVCGDPTTTPEKLASCAKDAASSVCEDDAEHGEVLKLAAACEALAN